jgi:hypothetical protein
MAGVNKVEEGKKAAAEKLGLQEINLKKFGNKEKGEEEVKKKMVFKPFLGEGVPGKILGL